MVDGVARIARVEAKLDPRRDQETRATEKGKSVRKTLLSVFVILLLVLSGVAQTKDVGIAAGVPGALMHSLATALAKVANEKAGVKATVQPFASTNVYIPAIDTGELQFGFGNMYETMLAYEGKDYFAGRPNKNLRVVAIGITHRNILYVRKDSPFHKIADLKGHRSPDGYSSQKIMLPIYDGYFATAGFTRADMKPVYVPTVVGGADALATGKADLFIFATGSAKVREVDASVGLRALSIENTPQSLAAMRKYFPVAYLKLEKPGPEAPGVLEPVYAFTQDGVLLSSSKVSDDLVYKITKAMYENKADLVATFPGFNDFEPEDMAKNIPVPYHPGAIKFYQEKGMWPPKK